jgi:predicted DNA-binding protein with PD1-like motif
MSMRTKLIHEAAGQRVFAIVLATGDETMACLTKFATEARLESASFTAIGAFKDAKLGYYDIDTQKYIKHSIDEQTEVASLTGDIATGEDGRLKLHIHCVLGRRDGSALAGHLIDGNVRPTLEVILTENPAHLRKRYDPASGLALIDLDQGDGSDE